MNLSEAASVASIAAITAGGIMFIQRLIMGSAIGHHNDDEHAHGITIVGRQRCERIHKQLNDIMSEIREGMDDIKETVGDIKGDIKVLNDRTKLLMKKAGLNGDS